MIETDSIQCLQIGKGWLSEQGGNGLDRVFSSLCRHLPETGVEITGLVAGSRAVEQESAGTICAFASDDAFLPYRLLAARRSVQSILNNRDIDLIASHFALYSLPLVSHLSDLPNVTHFHGPWALESAAEGENGLVTRVKAEIEQQVYRQAHRYIVLSKAFKSLLIENYNVPGEQVRIVPGGVQVEQFTPDRTPAEARAHLDWPTDRPILLTVRRLVKRVGLENLVDAMRYVRHHHPEALLYIAGKGPLAGELRSRIRAHDLEDHVQLLGFVPDEDLPIAYRGADVSIVPTQSLEGFGLVAVESLAAGTPVLVTPVGGLPEVVNDLSSDLILEDATTETIQEHLAAVLSGSLTLPDAEECHTYAAARYDWPVIARQVRNVYEEVL